MKSPHRLSLQRFSTAGIAPKDRHEAWVNRSWPSIAPIFQTAPLGAFDVTSDRVVLGDLVLHYADISGQRYDRPVSMVRSHDPDALAVTITVSGEARGEMGERSFHTTAGDIMLGDLSQPSAHESTASRTILLSVPRVTAVEAGLDVLALHGVVLNSAASLMLGSHLLRLREALPGYAETDGPRLGRTVLDLLILAVEASGRELPTALQARGATAALFARDEIENRLGSPSLTIANLCRVLGVSRTTLHRMFEAEGGVQAYIRNRRLEQVRLALADQLNVERIGEIAERLCFSDTAHLSRLFRARFGQTPSDFRAQQADLDLR